MGHLYGIIIVTEQRKEEKMYVVYWEDDKGKNWEVFKSVKDCEEYVKSKNIERYDIALQRFEAEKLEEKLRLVRENVKEIEKIGNNIDYLIKL